MDITVPKIDDTGCGNTEYALTTTNIAGTCLDHLVKNELINRNETIYTLTDSFKTQINENLTTEWNKLLTSDCQHVTFSTGEKCYAKMMSVINAIKFALEPLFVLPRFFNALEQDIVDLSFKMGQIHKEYTTITSSDCKTLAERVGLIFRLITVVLGNNEPIASTSYNRNTFERKIKMSMLERPELTRNQALEIVRLFAYFTDIKVLGKEVEMV